MDKYVQNLIKAGASPHLIAKLSTLPPTPTPQPSAVEEPVQDNTHGSDDPAPAPKRGKPRKAK
jgi:hypothetical protein